MKRMICLLCSLLLLVSLSACGEDAPTAADPTTTTTTTTTESTATTTLPQGAQLHTLRFTGRVLEIAEGDPAVLMECIGITPFGDRVWVQLGRCPDADLQVGATYIVTYEDMVMPSLPPRITAVTVTPTEDSSATTTTTTTTTKKSTTTTTTAKKSTTTTAPIQPQADAVRLPMQKTCHTLYGTPVAYVEGEQFAFRPTASGAQVAVIRSLEQLQSVGYNTPLEPLPERYNEAFFKDKALVVLNVCTSGYVAGVRVRALEVKGSILGVDAMEKHPYTDGAELPTVVENATVVMEVRAADIAGVTTVDYYCVYDEPIPTVTVPASEQAEKSYCTATLENDFREGTVLISLHHSVSMTYHYFTAEQFSEMFGITIVEADDLAYHNQVKPCSCLINWPYYKQIYRLTLPQKDKQAVLDAIRIIEQHPYVSAAEPNYIMYPQPD